jgi:hypothetical protein
VTIRVTSNHVLSAARFVGVSAATRDDVHGTTWRSVDAVLELIRHELSMGLSGEGTQWPPSLAHSEVLDAFRASYEAECKRRKARAAWCREGRS